MMEAFSLTLGTADDWHWIGTSFLEPASCSALADKRLLRRMLFESAE